MSKERKKEYTREEIDELKAWFECRQLPESMQLDKATYIPDVRDTLDCLIGQAYICYETPRLHGCIYLLERIKKKLENGGE